MSEQEIQEMLSEIARLRAENAEKDKLIEEQGRKIEDLEREHSSEIKELHKQIADLSKHLESVTELADLFKETREHEKSVLEKAQNDARIAKTEAEAARKEIEQLKNGDLKDIVAVAVKEAVKKAQEPLQEEISNLRLEMSKKIATLEASIANLSKKNEKELKILREEVEKAKLELDTQKALIESVVKDESLDKMLERCEDVIASITEARFVNLYLITPEKDDSGKDTGKLILMNKNGIQAGILDPNSMIAKAIEKNAVLIENIGSEINNVGDNKSDVANNIMIIPKTIDSDTNTKVVAVAKDAPDIGFHAGQAKIAMGEDTVAHNVLIGAAKLKALEQLAYTNPVSGYANEAALKKFILDKVFDESKQENPTCVISLDIDFFKKFNDTYGHDVGDKALKHVLDTISAQVRDSDKVCHPHGEEMTVILPNCTIEMAAEVAERIRRAVEHSPLVITDKDGTVKSLDITVTSGVAEFDPSQDISKNDMIKAFEQAMEISDTRLNDGKGIGRNVAVTNDESSASNLFKKYIESYGYEIQQDSNGYTIIDVMNSQDTQAVIAKDLDFEMTLNKIKELTQSDFLDNSVDGLKAKLEEYQKEKDIGGNIEFNSLEDVAAFVSDVDRGFKPAYKEFVQENRADLNMVTVLTDNNRKEKINLENVSTEKISELQHDNDINLFKLNIADRTYGVDSSRELPLPVFDLSEYAFVIEGETRNGDEVFNSSLDARIEDGVIKVDIYNEQKDYIDDPYTKYTFDLENKQGLTDCINEYLKHVDTYNIFTEEIEDVTAETERVSDVLDFSDSKMEKEEEKTVKPKYDRTDD